MKPPPLTPEERRRLIEAPIVVRTIGGRGWGGASFAHIGLGLRSRSRSIYYDSDERQPIPEESSDADHFPR